jgi:hypothetical protein
MSFIRRQRDPWASGGIEPALREVLADPLVHLVMRRDGVSPAELAAVVAAARQKLGFRDCLCRLAA